MKDKIETINFDDVWNYYKGCFPYYDSDRKAVETVFFSLLDFFVIKRFDNISGIIQKRSLSHLLFNLLHMDHDELKQSINRIVRIYYIDPIGIYNDTGLLIKNSN